MSVLVVSPDEINGPAVVELLVAEGDDVGVIVKTPEEGEEWKARGAHVAVGPPDDADLIERAAQHARSIVLFDPRPDALQAAVEGARMVGGSPARIVCCAQQESSAEHALADSGLEYVLLGIPVSRGGLLRLPRRAVDPRRVAAAVSAADDLGGELRMTADLGTGSGWRSLGLEE